MKIDANAMQTEVLHLELDFKGEVGGTFSLLARTLQYI